MFKSLSDECVWECSSLFQDFKNLAEGLTTNSNNFTPNKPYTKFLQSWKKNLVNIL